MGYNLQVREDIYSGCYMELGRLRSLDTRNPYPRFDPDPRRNLPTSSRVPVRRVVVQSGPDRIGTQSGDNYSAGRYPGVPPSPWRSCTGEMEECCFFMELGKWQFDRGENGGHHHAVRLEPVKKHRSEKLIHNQYHLHDCWKGLSN